MSKFRIFLKVITAALTVLGFFLIFSPHKIQSITENPLFLSLMGILMLLCIIGIGILTGVFTPIRLIKKQIRYSQNNKELLKIGFLYEEKRRAHVKADIVFKETGGKDKAIQLVLIKKLKSTAKKTLSMKELEDKTLFKKIRISKNQLKCTLKKSSLSLAPDKKSFQEAEDLKYLKSCLKKCEELANKLELEA